MATKISAYVANADNTFSLKDFAESLGYTVYMGDFGDYNDGRQWVTVTSNMNILSKTTFNEALEAERQNCKYESV